MARDNQNVARECGPGWESLIDPILAKINETDGTVQQIKEKFGRLRIYHDAGIGEIDEEIERMIDDAERKSASMCEFCGKTAVLMYSGSWYKTCCKEHAIEYGYKEKA